jgi:hypothetical protein
MMAYWSTNILSKYFRKGIYQVIPGEQAAHLFSAYLHNGISCYFDD